MNREPVFAQYVPEGCERYGNTPDSGPGDVVSVYAIPGTEPAAPSGVPWGVMDHCEYHYPEGHDCRAPKVRGDNFCIGHKRARQKLEKEVARQEETSAQLETESVLEAEIQE